MKGNASEKSCFLFKTRENTGIFFLKIPLKRRLLITEYTICNISKMLHILSFSNIFDSSKIKICTYKRKFGF